MYRTLYKLNVELHKNDLGAQGFLPPPQFLKNIFARYPMQQRVLSYARLLKGQAVYKDVPQEVGCASSVSRLLDMVDPSLLGYPAVVDNIVSTVRLADAMEESPRFIRLYKPINGCVVIDKTGSSSRVGHTGIYDHGRIWSNRSDKGVWDNYWRMDAWRQYYEGTLKLTTLYYFPLGN